MKAACRCAALLCLLGQAAAQDLPVYTDGLLNAFQNFSYGEGSDFANVAPFHDGAPSIAFTGNNNFGGNAVSFAHPSAVFAPGSYRGLRFFVHGGGSGGQALKLMLQTDSNTPGAAPSAAAPA